MSSDTRIILFNPLILITSAWAKQSSEETEHRLCASYDRFRFQRRLLPPGLRRVRSLPGVRGNHH